MISSKLIMPVYAKATAFCLAFAYSSFAIKKHLLTPLNTGLEEEMSSYEDTERRVDEFEHRQEDEVIKIGSRIERLMDLRAINDKNAHH